MKNFKFLYYLTVLLMFLLLSAFTQSDKEKLEAKILELTPSNLIIKNFKNLVIIGFDVLDRNEKPLTSKKFSFIQGDNFYVVLYARRKIFRAESPSENFLSDCKASLEYQDGGYFWSNKTYYIWERQKERNIPTEWEIGGVYKIKFAFKVPNLVSPGTYKFRIYEEKTNHPNFGRLIAFDDILFNIKTRIFLENEDRNSAIYYLPLHECLLNPAVLRTNTIDFYWTGNVEYFLNESLKKYKKVLILARGTPAGGIYPLLKIFGGSEEIGAAYVGAHWMEYEFDIRLVTDSHVLKIRFDNNQQAEGQDRNMYIRKIELIK